MQDCEHPLATESAFRILYLGNDLGFIAAFRKAVSESVYRLVSCGDQGSAVLFLESNIRYDLLLIDHDWRINEGLKLARLTRAQPHRKRMPIVLLSAASLDAGTKALARKAGVVECALKSADLKELVSKLLVRE